MLDEQPFRIDISYMPLSVIPNLKLEHIKRSIYHYIEKILKLKIQSSHITIKAELSTQLEQQYLGLKETEPYIEKEQIAYLSSGVIFEYTLARQRYDEFEFHTILVRQ